MAKSKPIAQCHRWATAVVFVAAALAGCGKGDPRTAKLVGKWKEPTGTTFMLSANGAISGDLDTAYLHKPDIPRYIHVAGTWWIDGKEFVTKIEQSSWKSDKVVGVEGREKILSISDDEFHTQTVKTGTYNDYTRVK